MVFSSRQLSEIKLKIINKINKEIDYANLFDDVEQVLNKYDIVYEEFEAIPVDTRTMKILVFGVLSGKKSDYQMLIKKMGIDPDHVHFVDDYNELSKYPVEKLRNSVEYSDILFGPVPHSQVSMGHTSSFLASIKQSPKEYPRLNEMVANSKLKITKSNFEQAVLRTRYYENMVS